MRVRDELAQCVGQHILPDVQGAVLNTNLCQSLRGEGYQFLRGEGLGLDTRASGLGFRVGWLKLRNQEQKKLKGV